MIEKYNRKTIEDAKEWATPFPIGLVPAIIADVQEKLSKKDNEMLVVTYQALDDPTASIKDYIVDSEFAARKIKHLQSCFGITYGAPLAGWKYKQGVVRTEEETYNGYKRAKVAGYCKYDENLRYEHYIPQNNDSQPVQEPKNIPPPPKFTDNVPF
jgi:hypothetical protein